MKLKHILTICLCVALLVAVSIGGTLAYLTDRDSEVNVFVVGDVTIDLTEDFQQGANLTPGVHIEKTPTITNTGTNDAWVWLEWAIPTALVKYDAAAPTTADNVIHTEFLSETADNGSAKTITQAEVDSAIAAGQLPAGTTAEYIQNGAYWLMSKQFDYVKQTEIDGVPYTVFVYLYNKALVKGESTLPGIWEVYMDNRVDIDPNGDWHFVEKGVATDLGWNSTTNGAPKIHASAYAVQADGFSSVAFAYAAYQEQWTK